MSEDIPEYKTETVKRIYVPVDAGTLKALQTLADARRASVASTAGAILSDLRPSMLEMAKVLTEAYRNPVEMVGKLNKQTMDLVESVTDTQISLIENDDPASASVRTAQFTEGMEKLQAMLEQMQIAQQTALELEKKQEANAKRKKRKKN